MSKSKCVGQQPPCPKACHAVKRTEKRKAHCAKNAPKGTKENPRKIGTRAQVWHGTADHTKGGLKKKDLVQNKAGKIVSKAKHDAQMEKNLWHLTAWRRALRNMGYLKRGWAQGKLFPKDVGRPSKPTGKNATAEKMKEYAKKLAKYNEYKKLYDEYRTIVERGPYERRGIMLKSVKSQSE
jgi:hypothetical protein